LSLVIGRFFDLNGKSVRPPQLLARGGDTVRIDDTRDVLAPLVQRYVFKYRHIGNGAFLKTRFVPFPSRIPFSSNEKYANLMPLYAFQKRGICNEIFITKANNYYSFTAFSTQISQSGRSLSCHFMQDAFITAVLGRLLECGLLCADGSRNNSIRRQCIKGYSE
jgi:hypothetical protein